MNIKRHFLHNPTGNVNQLVSTNIPRVTTANIVSVNPPNHNSGAVFSSLDRGGGDNVAQIRHTNFSNASLFNPLGFVAPSVQIFKEMVLKDIVALKAPRFRSNNDFQCNWKQIGARNDIVICPADKGGVLSF